MATPTTVIDSATIEMSGVKNIGDLMHKMPALLDGIGGSSNNDAAHRQSMVPMQLPA
ncbi:hypothetical protein [Aliikangiella maris]|uniref:Motility protein n=2 Tax=Aliikangiella maris TaxID=3162458 RepID=A0ABV2BNQ8_9GAMM